MWWIEGVWFFIALAMGIPWIIWDEIRPRRMAAKRGKTRRDEKRLHDTSEADAPAHRTL